MVCSLFSFRSPVLQKSFSYLGVDLLESTIWLFLILYLDGLTKENTLLNWTCWVAYWLYQGTFLLHRLLNSTQLYTANATAHTMARHTTRHA